METLNGDFSVFITSIKIKLNRVVLYFGKKNVEVIVIA
jgi:hypothetical protein